MKLPGEARKSLPQFKPVQITEHLDVHLLDIQRINATAFKGKDVFDIAEVTQALKNPRSVLVVVRAPDEERIVGYGLAVPTNKSHEAHYLATAVLPEYQGLGVGTTLASAIEDGMRDAGYLFYTRESTKEKNYAEHVLAAYGERVIESKPVTTAVGPSLYMKIAL